MWRFAGPRSTARSRKGLRDSHRREAEVPRRDERADRETDSRGRRSARSSPASAFLLSTILEPFLDIFKIFIFLNLFFTIFKIFYFYVFFIFYFVFIIFWSAQRITLRGHEFTRPSRGARILPSSWQPSMDPRSVDELEDGTGEHAEFLQSPPVTAAWISAFELRHRGFASRFAFYGLGRGGQGQDGARWGRSKRVLVKNIFLWNKFFRLAKRDHLIIC